MTVRKGPGIEAAGAGGASRLTIVQSSNPVGASKGSFPAAISYSITPKDQMSLRASAASPRKISGAA